MLPFHLSQTFLFRLLFFSQQREVGTPAYSNAHYYGITIGVIYCILFVCGVPIAGMYIIYINRAKMQHRTMRSAFGFLFEGYRDGALYWEFAVLLRKVAILAVSLFWQDAFLQSVAALFVLMISIVMHLWFLPYEQSFLNNAELASLISLFTLSGVSLLLWYVQPRSDFVVLYEVSYCVLYCVHIWLVLSHAHHDSLSLTHTHTLSLSLIIRPPSVQSSLRCTCHLVVCLSVGTCTSNCASDRVRLWVR